MSPLSSLALGLATIVSIAASPKLAASNATALDITESSVCDDLEAFYGDEYGDKILTNLTPNKVKGDDYNDFKFYHLYPHQGDLYFYFYARAGFTIDTVTLEFDDSTTIGEDNEVEESWHVTGEDGVPRVKILDTYGKMNIFYKCVIEDYYVESVGSTHRIFVDSLTGYTTLDEELLFSRKCQEAELLWEDTSENEDLVYKYYKDNYILIDQAEYWQQWVPTRYNNADQNYPTEIMEVNWLLFSWSGTSIGGLYELGELKKVVLDYEYLQYEAVYTADYSGVGMKMTPVYYGTHDHTEPFRSTLQGLTYKNIHMQNEVYSIGETTITPMTRTYDEVSDEREFWQFFSNAHRVTYTYNSIQSLDTQSISQLTDENTRDFFYSQVGTYKYAIAMKQDFRYILERDYKPYAACDVTSLCHEIVSPRITRLTFNSEFGDVELNAMMHPVELSGVFTTTGTVTEIENSTVSTVKDTLRIVFYALAAVLLLTVTGFAVVGIVRFARKPYKKEGKR